MKKTALVLMVLSMFWLLSCGGSSDATTSTEVKLLPPKGDEIYFGAFPDFGGSEDEVSQERVELFEAIAQKEIAWAVFSNNWYNGVTYPKAHIHAIDESGAMPYVRLMPRSDEIQGRAESKFSMQHILDGDFDTELRAWARDAISDNIPLLMDFAVEPNGDWFQWSGIFNGGSVMDKYGESNYPDGPERYRDAYRHVIDIFREEGVKHVTWFFHYNYLSFPDASWNKPKYYYPGDKYIDWIGFSLYGAQTIHEEWEGLEFSTQLQQSIDDLNTISTTKPIALLEMGVTDGHPEGDKHIWLDDAFSTILDSSLVKFDAISPWHEDWENEDGTLTQIRLDSSEETQRSFRRWIGEDRFISTLRFYRGSR
jgi:hypothetical protein